MAQLPEREWISAEEAAEYLQVGKPTICKYIRVRLLIGNQPKRRGRIWVLTASVRKLLENPERMM